MLEEDVAYLKKKRTVEISCCKCCYFTFRMLKHHLAVVINVPCHFPRNVNIMSCLKILTNLNLWNDNEMLIFSSPSDEYDGFQN
jgi:hypothetical protein